MPEKRRAQRDNCQAWKKGGLKGKGVGKSWVLRKGGGGGETHRVFRFFASILAILETQQKVESPNRGEEVQV